MQYVLDELSGLDRALFEARLENDLAACEAVAKAARLRMGLEHLSKVGEDRVLLSPQPALRRNQSALAVVGACMMLTCLIIVAISGPHRDNHDNDVDLAQVRVTDRSFLNLVDRENVELVSLWRSGMASPETATDEPEEEWQDPPASDALPSWLLAGVSLELNETRPTELQNRKDN